MAGVCFAECELGFKAEAYPGLHQPMSGTGIEPRFSEMGSAPCPVLKQALSSAALCLPQHLTLIPLCTTSSISADIFVLFTASSSVPLKVPSMSRN